MRVPVPALLSMLVLSGCALPPIITVASLAANGVSYATTGKGTADHAISAVAGEDCAILRAASDEAICDPDGEVLIALTRTDPADENWDFDPEIDSLDSNGISHLSSASDLEAKAEPAPGRPDAPRTLDETTTGSPALRPGPVGKRKSNTPLATLIALAAEPSPRGFFADAHPAPKPAPPLLQQAQAPDPQVQDQSTSWLERLTAKTRSVLKNPVREVDSTAP